MSFRKGLTDLGTKKKNKKAKSLKFKIAIISVALIVIGVGGYFVWDKFFKEGSNSSKATKTIVEAKFSDSDDINKLSVEESDKINIQGAIAVKEFSYLESYLAQSIKLTIVGDEIVSRDESSDGIMSAMADCFADASGNGDWSFSVGYNNIEKLKKGPYSEYIKSSSVIGEANSNHAVIINFNGDKKIDNVIITKDKKFLEN